MKLSKTDQEILLRMGYLKEDFAQIEEALTKTKYSLCDSATNKEKKISCKKARELLGDETFLSGIGRSTFHWSCSRYVDDKTEIGFDSSALFEEINDESKEKNLEVQNSSMTPCSTELLLKL